MSAGTGWMGAQGQVTYVLGLLGADRDPEGRFLIQNGGVFNFLGIDDPGADCVVDSTAEYLIGGSPHNLAAALNATSYGLRGITVIS